MLLGRLEPDAEVVPKFSHPTPSSVRAAEANDPTQ
jgi:hypothetical protein